MEQRAFTKMIVQNSLPVDPLELISVLWPHVRFYDKQEETLYSCQESGETYVPAANMMGKDFVAAYVVLAFFLTRHPCRIITTSVKDSHLDVLWGEIGRAIDTCAYPLSVKAGGPLQILQRKIMKVHQGELCKISYVKGMVADDMNAMQGHHVAKTGDNIPRTMFVVDEAAGVKNEYYDMAMTWADLMLIFGNCNPCNNFFRKGVEKGRVMSKDGKRCFSNVIRIKAEDSPNVRLALAQQRAGKEVTNEMLIPGVLSAADYFKRRETWDRVRQCVGLDGQFYEGGEILLYPPEWLNNAERLALDPKPKSGRKTIGVDTAYGGDKTVWLVLSHWGVEEVISMKTPDTSGIVGQTLALARKHNVIGKDTLFDFGGGGKAHVDILRSRGFNARAIAFGGGATPQKKRGMTILEKRIEEDETRYAYKNRRAEMYGLLSRKLDPQDGGGLAIPSEYVELRRQLAPVPKKWDKEGRLYLPPKQRKNKDDTEETMTEILGCSPDESDALVLAHFGLHKHTTRAKAGAIL